MQYSGARLHNSYTDVNPAAQALSLYGGFRAEDPCGIRHCRRLPRPTRPMGGLQTRQTGAQEGVQPAARRAAAAATGTGQRRHRPAAGRPEHELSATGHPLIAHALPMVELLLRGCQRGNPKHRTPPRRARDRRNSAIRPPRTAVGILSRRCAYCWVSQLYSRSSVFRRERNEFVIGRCKHWVRPRPTSLSNWRSKRCHCLLGYRTRTPRPRPQCPQRRLRPDCSIDCNPDGQPRTIEVC
jgi:hypothetical protein